MTPAPSTPPTDRILRAILSTVVAMTCFAILNGMSKTLSTSGYPVIEVIWSRYFFAFVFTLVLFTTVPSGCTGESVSKIGTVGAGPFMFLLALLSTIVAQVSDAKMTSGDPILHESAVAGTYVTAV